jgi:acyl-CoA synthetase (AMP-forming)/AMP-acid ligase II
LGEAVIVADATMVFASPAALANVVATADELTDRDRSAFARVRLLLSAGAPVRPALLREAAQLFPNASVQTPYGMTECLPVASIDLDEITAASGGDGVCVGHPVPGVDVAIRRLDQLGRATDAVATEPDVIGEVIVRAAHARDGYDRLWHTTFAASRPPGWHTTGDVGHLDRLGRLWIGGRRRDVIGTATGLVTPVRVEQAVETIPSVQLAAVVGAGPRGLEQIVVVVESRTAPRSPTLATPEMTDRVRRVVDQPVVAVFEVPALPVDRRHNSKIDRARVAAWVEVALAGGRAGRL